MQIQSNQELLSSIKVKKSSGYYTVSIPRDTFKELETIVGIRFQSNGKMTKNYKMKLVKYLQNNGFVEVGKVATQTRLWGFDNHYDFCFEISEEVKEIFKDPKELAKILKEAGYIE